MRLTSSEAARYHKRTVRRVRPTGKTGAQAGESLQGGGSPGTRVKPTQPPRHVRPTLSGKGTETQRPGKPGVYQPTKYVRKVRKMQRSLPGQKYSEASAATKATGRITRGRAAAEQKSSGGGSILDKISHAVTHGAAAAGGAVVHTARDLGLRASDSYGPGGNQDPTGLGHAANKVLNKGTGIHVPIAHNIAHPLNPDPSWRNRTDSHEITVGDAAAVFPAAKAATGLKALSRLGEAAKASRAESAASDAVRAAESAPKPRSTPKPTPTPNQEISAEETARAQGLRFKGGKRENGFERIPKEGPKPDRRVSNKPYKGRERRKQIARTADSRPGVKGAVNRARTRSQLKKLEDQPRAEPQPVSENKPVSQPAKHPPKREQPRRTVEVKPPRDAAQLTSKRTNAAELTRPPEPKRRPQVGDVIEHDTVMGTRRRTVTAVNPEKGKVALDNGDAAGKVLGNKNRAPAHQWYKEDSPHVVGHPDKPSRIIPKTTEAGATKLVVEPKAGSSPRTQKPVAREEVTPVEPAQAKANTLASITKRPRYMGHMTPEEVKATRELEAEGRVHMAENGTYRPGPKPGAKPQVAGVPANAAEAKAAREAPKPKPVNVEAKLRETAAKRKQEPVTQEIPSGLTPVKKKPEYESLREPTVQRQQKVTEQQTPAQRRNERRRQGGKMTDAERQTRAEARAAQTTGHTSAKAEVPKPAENKPTSYQRAETGKGKANPPAQGETVTLKVHTKKYDAEVVKVGKKRVHLKYTNAAGKTRTVTRPLKDYTRGTTGKVIHQITGHPGRNTLFGLSGAGAVGAVKHRDPKRVQAPFVGAADALTHPSTYATTVRSIPGMVTAQVGMAANAGVSGYRAIREAADLAHVPVAGKHYSAEEIAAPTVKSVEAVAKFGADMAAAFASGDSKRISKAMQNDYGLTPFIMAGIPGARLAGKLGAGEAASSLARKSKWVDTALDNRAMRKHQAKEAGYSETVGKHWSEKAAHDVIKNINKVKGRKGYVRNRKNKIEPGDTLKIVAEEGIKTVEDAKKVLARLPAKAKGVEGISAHDALQGLIDNPGWLKDEHYLKAAKAYRKQAKEIETSLRAKWGKMALTYKVPLPEDRYLAAMHTAQELVNEAKTPQQRAKALKGVQIVKDKQNASFEAAMKGVAKQHDLAEPAYTGDLGLDFEKRLTADPKYPRGAYKQHETKLTQSERGMASHSFARLLETGVRQPRVIRAENAARARFAEEEALAQRVPGPHGMRTTKYLTSKEIAGLNLDPKKFSVVDAQQMRSALIPGEVDNPLVEFGKADSGQPTLAQAIKLREGEAKAGLDISKGKKYIVVHKTASNEFFKQREPITGAEKAIHRSQRSASRAILGYSPSWLMAQPVAEAAQGLAAVSNPIWHIQGRRALTKMKAVDKEFGLPEGTTRRAFAEHVGGTSGAADIKEFVGTLRHDSTDFDSAINKMGQHSITRVGRDILTGRGASKIDRKKGALIREQVAAAHVAREYSKFKDGMRGLMKMGKKYDGMPLEERMARIGQNRAEGRKIENYVDDVMGNWRALTARERNLSSLVVFYPFVRMSLDWVFHSFPKRHPIKAATINFMGQQQAEAIEQIYGGKPGFFSQFGNAPIYSGRESTKIVKPQDPAFRQRLAEAWKANPTRVRKIMQLPKDATVTPDGTIKYSTHLGDPTSMLPLSRIAPGSNALIEAIGGEAGPITGGIRALNPWAGVIASGVSGTDPLSGRSLANKGERMSTGEHVANAAATMGSMNFPTRLGLTLSGKMNQLRGKDEDAPTSQLLRQLQGGDTRKVLSGIMPFIPKNTSRERQLTEIGRLLERKYAVPQGDPTYFSKVIRPQVIKDTKGGKNPRGSVSEQMIVNYLDTRVAANQLKKLYKRYGLNEPKTLTGRQADLAQAMQTTQVGGHWNDIMKDALGKRENSRPTGLKADRLKALRRARARKLMGNS